MKQYQGEKAIISLTSWKARIKTVGLTIYSLLTQCPGFHIVLVLSEEEFPKKEAELPEDLVLMSRCGKIEILWVYRNYKSFKKVLFTMDKYRDVPIISADDDCIYTCNYAEELYQAWTRDTTSVIRYNMYNKNPNWYYTQGPCTIYPPAIIELFMDGYTNLSNVMTIYKGDDTYLTKTLKANNIRISYIYRGHKFPFIFHDEVEPLSGGNNLRNPDFAKCYINN